MRGREIIKEWEKAQESGLFKSYTESMAWLAAKIDSNNSTEYYEKRIQRYEDDNQREIDRYKNQDLDHVWS